MGSDGDAYESLDRAFMHVIALDAINRERFVAKLAASDPTMAVRLASLIAADALQDSQSGIRGEDALIEVRLSAGIGGDGGILTGRQIGGFEIGELIGQGGSGAVYRARQQRPARTVAFKSLRPEIAGPRARKRFELEAEHMALLSHPNIATVIAAGFDEESRVSWMAVEFIEGAKSIVRRSVDEGLSTVARLELMRAACSAVAEAHAKGVLHRDLKPSNLLVGNDGMVKVIDFGLARALATPDGRSVATETGEIVGTLLYMSPEQCTGDPRAIDVRSDVFALGAVLYELITEKAPRSFDGLSLPAAIMSVSETDVPTPSRANPLVSRDLDAVVAMACARHPLSRYSSVREMSADLERVIAGEPVHARAPGRLRKFQWWVRREPKLALAISVALVATVSFVVAAGIDARDKRAEAKRASEISRRVYDQLVPAARKLGITQDAPYIREIDEAAYELSVLVNGVNHDVSAGLALKNAFDWLKGVGYDAKQSERWAQIAVDSAQRAPGLGPDSKIALEARCVGVWAFAKGVAELREPDRALELESRRRHEELLPIIEARDDVDLASDCLGALGEYAEADGNLALAADYYRRAVERSTRIKGESDELVVQARSYLVDTLRKQMRWDEALLELDSLLLIQRGHERGFSPWTIRFAMQRGEALLRLNRPREAEQQLVEAEILVRDRIGPTHGMRNRVRFYLREALVAQNRADEAAQEWKDIELSR